MSEYTLLRNWMELWLKWLHWYCTVPLGYDPSMEELFNPPIVATSWRRSTFDPVVKVYGLLWRCYDEAQGWTLGSVPGVLEPLSPRSGLDSDTDKPVVPPSSKDGVWREWSWKKRVYGEFQASFSEKPLNGSEKATCRGLRVAASKDGERGALAGAVETEEKDQQEGSFLLSFPCPVPLA